MTSFKILQYNTDNLRHGWDYFAKNLNKADLAVLQRFPRNKKSSLYEVMDDCRSYMVESCPPNELCLAIARNNNVSNFSGVEAITLPSAMHVIALGEPSQGCTALKTVIDGVNFVSFLPCYSTENEEYPISESETKSDIKFLLDRFEKEPTIIMGDFHFSPDEYTVNDIIKRKGFVSHLDNVNTFIGNNLTFFNLDKCISNIDIKLSNIQVDKVEDQIGHMAITYTLEIVK